MALVASRSSLQGVMRNGAFVISIARNRKIRIRE
jgi:hypothetical protein